MKIVEPPSIGLAVARTWLRYERNTGFLYWKVNRGRKAKVGYRAGYAHHTGYREIIIEGRSYMEHTIIWWLVTGEWPSNTIDHKNTLRDDNKWKNLRPATQKQQCFNAPVHHNHSVGLKGVQKRWNRYRARIFLKGKHVILGTFTTAEEAHKAYCAAAKTHFGEFARFS